MSTAKTGSVRQQLLVFSSAEYSLRVARWMFLTIFADAVLACLEEDHGGGWQLFFGLYLPALGYMIIKSDLFGGSNSVSSQMAASSLYSTLEK